MYRLFDLIVVHSVSFSLMLGWQLKMKKIELIFDSKKKGVEDDRSHKMKDGKKITKKIWKI
jgi:hypothetical protein